MSLSVEEKKAVIEKFGRTEGDTGSAPVQIALITARLESLQGHFKINEKDHHSRTGLLKLVGRRRRLLDYMKRVNTEEYRRLIDSLGLRK